MSTIADADEFRQQLSVLASRLDVVEARLDKNVAASASTPDLAGVIAEVRTLTQELFPGKCEFTSEFDPEYPEDRYVVVTVEATGDPEELVERTCEWDRRVRESWPDLWDTLRLLIVPR